MSRFIAAIALAALGLTPIAAAAQDSGQSQSGPESWEAPPAPPAPVEDVPPADTANEWVPVEQAIPADPPAAPAGQGAAAGTAGADANANARAIPRRDIFDAAENVFGRGAEDLGRLLERILRDQGEPIAYISGQEASGALVVGLRYGSGVMRHRIEGDRDVYWTGPSIGFDAGAQASKVFILVYNLHDGQRLFRRYPAAEGNAYVVGGFTASYLRRGDVVLIPVRLGVGLRLGVNAGYMRFSERNRWVPF